MKNKWHERFIDTALLAANWSKDPSTQVGAVLVGPDKEILSVGYNGFPRGVADTDERLNDRPTKYELVVHAEINSIMNAARNGVCTKHSTLYVIAYNRKTKQLWGGAPCIRCAVETIQAGIGAVIVPAPTNMPDSWKESCEKGASVLKEAGVIYTEIEGYEDRLLNRIA
jgi:dCMP deaminase